MMKEETRRQAEQLCAFLRVNDVPHLGLAVLSLDPQCVFVVRVHLHGQVILRVYQLYQYREVLKAPAVRA